MEEHPYTPWPEAGDLSQLVADAQSGTQAPGFPVERLLTALRPALLTFFLQRRKENRQRDWLLDAL